MSQAPAPVKSDATEETAEAPRLNHEDAAAFLGYTVKTLYFKCHKGLIPYEQDVEEGHLRNFYRLPDLQEVLDKRRRPFRTSKPQRNAAKSRRKKAQK